MAKVNLSKKHFRPFTMATHKQPLNLGLKIYLKLYNHIWIRKYANINLKYKTYLKLVILHLAFKCATEDDIL